MIIQPYSYNGTLLQSTDFETSIPRQSALAQLEANLGYVRRSGAEPVYSGKDFQPVTLNLEVKLMHDFMTTLETLNNVFDVHDETPRQFIVRDLEDTSTDASGKQYYTYATTKRVLGGHDGQMSIVTIGLDPSTWLSAKEYSLTFTTSDTSASTDITNNGNIKTYPQLEISVSAYPGTGYIYNQFVQYAPGSSDAWKNRPLEITGGFDSAALVSGLKATTDGADFRVFVDGVEVDRWLADWGTTDTQAWINIDQPAKRELKLKNAIGSTDTVTAIEFLYSAAATADFTAMPTTGRFLINSEEFTYTSKTITTTMLRANGVTRSVRNTSAAAHSSSDTVKWIPYDINVVYGNLTATAPDVDDTKKPLINLSTSSNASFVYSEFGDEAALRSGRWNGSVIKRTSALQSISALYTDVNGADADPYTTMGMFIGAYQSAGVWKAETSTLQWQAYFPDVVTSVSHSYERYQTNGGAWVTTAALQRSPDGSTWTNAKSFAALTSSTDLAVWVTGTDATTDISITAGTKYLRYYFSGTIKAIASNSAYLGFTDVTVNFTNPPVCSLRGEQNNYQFNHTITNSNGQSLTVNYPLRIGDTLYIDCDPDFPYAKLNGQIVNGCVTLNTVRPEWLALESGSNTLTCTADNVGAISIVYKWRDKMNFL